MQLSKSQKRSVVARHGAGFIFVDQGIISGICTLLTYFDLHAIASYVIPEVETVTKLKSTIPECWEVEVKNMNSYTHPAMLSDTDSYHGAGMHVTFNLIDYYVFMIGR